MKICVLMSGSKGNLTYVESEKEKILIDAGAGIRTVDSLLQSIGVRLKEIGAVLVTHEHDDHCRGLKRIAELTNAKIYAHREGKEALCKKTGIREERVLSFDKPFEIGAVAAEFYVCSHDAAHCVGYSLEEGKEKISVVTDLGFWDEKTLRFLKNSDIAVVESNHDPEMLQKGSYPYPLKRRISGEKGHLSNAQAGELVSLLPEENVRRVILGHLSLNNNIPELAYTSAVKKAEEKGVREGVDIEIDVARQFQRSDFYDVEKRRI